MWPARPGANSDGPAQHSSIPQHPARGAGREQGWGPGIDREAAAMDRSERMLWKDRVRMEWNTARNRHCCDPVWEGQLPDPRICCTAQGFSSAQPLNPG